MINYFYNSVLQRQRTVFFISDFEKMRSNIEINPGVPGIFFNVLAITKITTKKYDTHAAFRNLTKCQPTIANEYDING